MIHLRFNPAAEQNPYPVVRVRFEPYPSTGASTDTLAIIDTGSSNTTVSNRIFTDLNVTPLGYRRLSANGRPDTTKYARAPLTMTVMDNDGVPHWCDLISVMASFEGEDNGRIECLMGFDVLRFANLRVEGEMGSAHLEFPGGYHPG